MLIGLLVEEYINQLKKKLHNEVFPFVANTHTETSTTGATGEFGFGRGNANN